MFAPIAWRLALLLALAVQLASSEIIHDSNTKMLKVLRNGYSQFRAVGQGFRDESIDQGYSQISISVDIESRPSADGKLPPQPFDLFILSDVQDYECYIRATVLLDQRMGLDCAFLKDPKQAQMNITEFKADLEEFIGANGKYREYFFIVDNTAFPLFNNELPFPEEGGGNQEDKSPRNDLLGDVGFHTKYQMTEEYTLYVFIAGVMCIAMLLILIILMCLYKKHRNIYAKLADQRRKSQSEKRRASEKAEALDETAEVSLN